MVHAEAEAEAGEDTASTKRSLGLRVSGGPFGRHEANAARRASCGGAAAVSLTVRMFEAQCRDVPASWRRSVCLLCGPTHSAESSAAETRREAQQAPHSTRGKGYRNYLVLISPRLAAREGAAAPARLAARVLLGPRHPLVPVDLEEHAARAARPNRQRAAPKTLHRKIAFQPTHRATLHDPRSTPRLGRTLREERRRRCARRPWRRVLREGSRRAFKQSVTASQLGKVQAVWSS